MRSQNDGGNLMKRIMFVCHGNICRSTMAEFLMKDLVQKMGKQDEFLIKSSATSSEELGNPVHYGTRKVLDRLGISCKGKYAEKLQPSDYNKYDYFICMDSRNLINISRIFKDTHNKVSLLMSYAGASRDVADPYWTGDFEATYRDVDMGIKALYNYLMKE